MRYVNAREVLPEPLVRELQNVVPGGCLYVPRDGESRRRWGEASGYRDELERGSRALLRPLGLTLTRTSRFM